MYSNAPETSTPQCGPKRVHFHFFSKSANFEVCTMQSHLNRRIWCYWDVFVPVAMFSFQGWDDFIPVFLNYVTCAIQTALDAPQLLIRNRCAAAYESWVRQSFRNSSLGKLCNRFNGGANFYKKEISELVAARREQFSEKSSPDFFK